MPGRRSVACPGHFMIVAFTSTVTLRSLMGSDDCEITSGRPLSRITSWRNRTWFFGPRSDEASTTL